MRLRYAVWLLPCLLLRAAEPDFARLHAVYQAAWDDFATADPRLEQELKTAPVNELIERIDAQQKRSERWIAAGIGLYDAIRGSLDRYVHNLPEKDPTSADTLTRTAAENLSAARDEIAAVEKELATHKDAGIVLALNDQLDELKGLETNLVKEGEGLAAIAASGAQAGAALDRSRQRLRLLVTELADAGERLRTIGAQHVEYYAALRAVVAKRNARPPNPLEGTWTLERPLAKSPVTAIRLVVTAGAGTLAIDNRPPRGSKIPAHIEAHIVEPAAGEVPTLVEVGPDLHGALTLLQDADRLQLVLAFDSGYRLEATLRRSAPQR